MSLRKSMRTLAVAFVALTAASSLKAEEFTSTYSVTQSHDYELITEMLVGPGVALHPSGKKLDQTDVEQIGIFSNLVANVIPSFTNGVILSTGRISLGPSLTNAYLDCSSKWLNERISDAICDDTDINTYFKDVLQGEDFYDPAGLILYIQPKNKTLNIPFVMASEEFYLDFTESDKFAFFMQEVGPAAECLNEKGEMTPAALEKAGKMSMTNNIAKLPDGSDIEITTVNERNNTSYFIPNVVTNDDGTLKFPAGDISLPMELNGAIVGPVAVAEDLDVNMVYKLKIMLADYYDNTCTSAVFLREKGITSGADLKIDVTGPANLEEPGPATFTDTVSNVGPATADGVVVTNYLPIGATDVSYDPAVGSVAEVKVGDANCLVWTIGDRFRSGSNAVMTVTCTLPAQGSYTNAAAVVTSTGDYDDKNDKDECVTTVGAPPATPITVRAISTNKVFGTEIALADLGFVLSITGTNEAQSVSGVDVKFLDANGVETYPTNSAAKAGTYQICLTNLCGTGLPPAEMITYEPGELRIDKAELTIIADDTNKVYGTSIAFAGTEFTTLPATLPEGVGVDSVTLTSLKATDAATDAGTYENEIVPSAPVGTGLENYEIAYSNGTLTVTKVPLTIIANDTNKVFGATITFAGTEFTTLPETLPSGVSVDSVTLTSEKAADPATEAGTYKDEIVARAAVGTGLDNYDIAYSNGTLTVTKIPLTIIANDTNKVYGASIAFAGTEFTTLPEELPVGVSVDSVTLTSAKAADAATAAGIYKNEIVPSAAVGTGLENYDVVYSNGLLTVDKREIEITPRNRTKEYGVNFNLTKLPSMVRITKGSLLTGDKLSSVILSSPGTAKTAAAGNYVITAEDARGTGLENYAISYGQGKLLVEKALLTIIANDTNKIYGTSLDFTGKEFTVEPETLPNGEKVETVTIASAEAADPATPVGTYEGSIVPSFEVTGIDPNNYEITFSNGTLTVTKAALTIIANSTNRVYGATIEFTGKEFTTNPAELPNGETIESVSITSTQAGNAAAPVDVYPEDIKPGYEVTGIDTNNYDITFSNGTLTVTKAALTIIANSTNRVYGTTLSFTGKEFTTEPAELPNGETVETVTITSPKAAEPTTPAGTYAEEIVPSHEVTGIDTNNYDIAFSNGTLTVTRAALTIIANDTNRVYGTTVSFTGKEFTTEPAELPNAEKVDSVTITSEKAADPTTKAGLHAEAIIPSHEVTGIDTNNYDIVFSNGTLTVTRAALKIIADSTNKVYGATITFTGKEFTTEPAELPNGETVETVTLTSEKAADSATMVGVYDEEVVPSHEVTGINTNNYDIVFSNGTLTVTQAALTITVNDAKWNVKKPRPSYSFADFSSQLKAGDTLADVTGGSGLALDVSYTNKVWETSVPVKGDEGIYTDEIWIDLASVDGARAANYVIEIDPGDLTVDTALPDLRITNMEHLNWDNGLEVLRLTISNEGDGEVDSDSEYWVELKPGEPVTDDKGNRYSRSHYLGSATGSIPDGYDYQLLTAEVKAALRATGNHDEMFDPGESVVVQGVKVFHYARSKPETFIDVGKFFVAGQLFNPADTGKDFMVSDEEKIAAAAILGESSADYLEVTRLNLLQHYHWSAAAGTWIGPSK